MKALYVSNVYITFNQFLPVSVNPKVINDNLQLFYDQLSHVYTNRHFWDQVIHISASHLTIRQSEKRIDNTQQRRTCGTRK